MNELEKHYDPKRGNNFWTFQNSQPELFFENLGCIPVISSKASTSALLETVLDLKNNNQL